MSAVVPYSLLRTLRACLDGTADQPAWDQAKDELDDLLLAEPEPSPVVSAACSLCEAGHVPLKSCDGLTAAERELLRPRPSILDASGPVSFDWGLGRPGPEGDGDPC